MKKQKLKRRTYRPVSKKVKTVKKVVWRILFVLICAVALCVFSVYLGSWLKERAAQIDSILTPDDTAQTESVTHETIPPATDSPEEEFSVSAAYLDVTAMTGAEIESYVYNLHESYNTVTVNIISDDGKLIYVSPALLEYVKLDPSNVTVAPIVGNASDDGDSETYEIDALANIKTVLDSAKRKGLRTCAVYSAAPAVMYDKDYEGAWEVDAVILGELYEMGFDEVLIRELFVGEGAFEAENTNKAATYAANLKEKAGEIGIGMVLPEEAFLISQNANVVKTLSGYVDFLSMYVDVDGADAEEAYSIAYEEFHSIKGTLNAYNVRAVILNEDEDVAAAVATALSDLASVSVQFTREVDSPVYSQELPEDTTETESSEAVYNENANRKDNYINDTEYEEGTSGDSTDVPDENGDGGEV